VAAGPSEPEHRPGPGVHRAARHRPVEPAELPIVLPPLAGKAALRASVQSCLARLHVDLRFYTTAMFTDDVSQILTDLHYAKANLFGGS
jgi:hypothetical protein